MGGFVAFEKGPIDNLYEELRTRIPGATVTVLMDLIWCANFGPGVFKGFEMSRGDVCVSISGIQNRTGHGKKTVENALKCLLVGGKILRKGGSEGGSGAMIYNIVNYDHYIHNFSEGGNEGGSRGEAGGKPGGQSKDLKEVKEVKEVDQNLSPDGEGQASPEAPPPDKVSPSRKRKSKDPSDHLTDPNIFLHRVEAEYPTTVLVWSRDVGAIKTLLSGRRRGGAVDPQGEAWGCWTRFMSGEVDDAITMRRRAHDVLTFVGHYALLVEESNGRTRESVYDKLSQWADREDEKEREIL